MKNIKGVVAQNIKKYREKAGLTQKELAEKLGLKHNAISAWETEQNTIDIETLFKICEIVKTGISNMYGAEEQKIILPVIDAGEYEEVIVAAKSKNVDPQKLKKIIDLIDNQG